MEPLTYSIIGCAMSVHKKLGCGFQEVIYQRCLAIELLRANISFLREKEQDIYYDECQVGTRRADFIVEDNVVIELKALQNLENVHIIQGKNYLVAYNYPIGLLINFGSLSLQYKRLYNSRYIHQL